MSARQSSSGASVQQGTGLPTGTTVKSYLPSNQVYEAVLDRIFPRDRKGQIYVIFLRFAPSGRAESQITIKGDFAGSEVLESTVIGNSTIVATLEGFLRRGGAESDLDQMAKLVAVRTRAVAANSSQAATWASEFLDALSASLPALRAERERAERTRLQDMVLDGTRYSVWYRQGAVENYSLSFAFDDSDSLEAAGGTLPVARWMNAVRLAIGKLPTR